MSDTISRDEEHASRLRRVWVRLQSLLAQPTVMRSGMHREAPCIEFELLSKGVLSRTPDNFVARLRRRWPLRT
jgi:hypothetical protein